MRLSYRRQGLAEDHAFRDLEARLPSLESFPGPARDIAEYALAELVNNAVDHSHGRRVSIRASLSRAVLILEVKDDGRGLFDTIQRGFGLRSLRDAVQELSSQSLTTDPKRHRGEGLQHIAEVVDRLGLESNGITMSIRHGERVLARGELSNGTRVQVVIRANTERRLRDALSESPSSKRSHVSVRLLSFGVRFLSRAEAKRLLDGLERFPNVTLDFSGVVAVGFGFADEVFRVWSDAHPETSLEPIRMAEDVALVIGGVR